MSTEEFFLIDIDRIIKEKAGNTARYIPRAVRTWLKHIVHQDEVNRFLLSVRELTGVEWLEACVTYLDMNLVVKGKDNLPALHDGKRYTFVSNHPLGGIDGVALGSILGRHYEGNVKYLVNDLLMNLHGLAPLCIPINKVGGQTHRLPQLIDEAFQSDNHIIMFPAGLCSRRQRGTIRDLAWKKAFLSKSLETQRDIVPIHFGGHNSPFFYRVAQLCSALHLKFNVAMLFLVDEMYKNTHKTFNITIGEPIAWQSFDKSRSLSDWVKQVQTTVYNLPQ